MVLSAAKTLLILTARRKREVLEELHHRCRTGDLAFGAVGRESGENQRLRLQVKALQTQRYGVVAGH